MPLVVTCNIEEDPIKVIGSIVSAKFSPYVYGILFLYAQGRVTSKQIVRSEIELIRY